MTSTINKLTSEEADTLAAPLAWWNQMSPLSKYLGKSWQWTRDYDKFGVYILLEKVVNEPCSQHPVSYVPRFIESIPVYVGMSTRLSQRLRMHATGRGSTPAEHVTAEYLKTATQADRDAYENASPEAQREIRELCMTNRHLWVKTAYTRDLLEARRLEKAMIRLYKANGVMLWNKLVYKTTPPWPSI